MAWGVSTALVLIAVPGLLRAADSAHPIFKAFPDPDGLVQAATANPTLNFKNKFFDPALGTNGQACVTCHQPADGFDIHVSSIQSAFTDTNGTDPLFRLNDTADRPDPPVGTTLADTYKLFLSMGVIRFARPAPGATADFILAPQNTGKYDLATGQFGPQPHMGDPQNATAQTISVFRRPLVNLNVGFDSSVLWDGRESITDLRTQVTKAAKSLLLAHDVSVADADNVAKFMLEVYVDQRTKDGPGKLSAAGADGGPKNLLALSQYLAQPCRFDNQGFRTQSVAPPVDLTPVFCTPVVKDNPSTMTVFDAWANMSGSDPVSVARASVARGQVIFNTKDLTVPPDLIPQFGGQSIHCITCHAVNNVGNHPDATFFARIGSDSVDILKGLVANPSTSDVASLQSTLARVQSLPEYCLRPTSDSTPFSTAACGSHITDLKTTDPGRATVTGKIADVGKFKPPVLRGFAARAPYFHAGAVIEDDDLVHFYNARFQIGLTDQEHEDLVAFLISF
jgi:hypothetical protein